jgi:hypothetical protein
MQVSPSYLGAGRKKIDTSLVSLVYVRICISFKGIPVWSDMRI